MRAVWRKPRKSASHMEQGESDAPQYANNNYHDDQSNRPPDNFSSVASRKQLHGAEKYQSWRAKQQRKPRLKSGVEIASMVLHFSAWQQLVACRQLDRERANAVHTRAASVDSFIDRLKASRVRHTHTDKIPSSSGVLQQSNHRSQNRTARGTVIRNENAGVNRNENMIINTSVRNNTTVPKVSEEVKEVKHTQQNSPAFLGGMEDRAVERRRRRESLQNQYTERARVAHEKRIQLQEAEEFEKIKEAEEKRSRALAVRQQARRRAQRQMAQVEREKQAISVAKYFRVESQLRFRGMLPWTKLLALQDDASVKATQHRTRTLLSNAMRGWSRRTCQTQQARQDQAVRFDELRCVRKWWNALRNQHARTLRAELLVSHRSKQRILVEGIRWWRRSATEQERRIGVLLAGTKRRFGKRLLGSYIRSWKLACVALKEEHELEARKSRSLARVSGWLLEVE